MSDQRKAAIDPDKIQDKALNSISAADFLEALGNAGPAGAAVFRAWPEKKKYELWAEPEFNDGISVGRLIERMTVKKKFELEKDPRPEIYKDITSEIPKRVGEFEIPNLKDFVVNPAVLASLANSIAIQVAQQLRDLGR